MHPLTQLIYNDMQPALGVTEPGAIAFAVARAVDLLPEKELVSIDLQLNSGMYKNAFTCGIPHSSAVGNHFAAALGAVAGNWHRGLEALAEVTQADNLRAQQLIDAGKVTVGMSGISSEILIQATVCSQQHQAMVLIQGQHTNITKMTLDGQILLDDTQPASPSCAPQCASPDLPLIHRYTLEQLVTYCQTVPANEIAFVQKAYEMNLQLYQVGKQSERTVFLHHLLRQNGGQELCADPLASAQLLCAGAIEARVLGLDAPAMSITGSGAHGIICTLPLYAFCQSAGIADEQLWRATILSYLITTYIKEYSGRLSAFCGCAIAAGTGMAVALGWLRGATVDQLGQIIGNMACSITGRICDGGNQGCTVKAVSAVDAAFRAVDFVLHGAYILPVHAINGLTPEDTMRQMGQIASPGMVETERVIVDIMQRKAAAQQPQTR